MICWESSVNALSQLFCHFEVTCNLNQFQRFIMILTEHIVRSEQQQLDVNTQWFKYTTERLREVLITVLSY